MTTSAGITFKSSKETVAKMREAIPQLDDIVNENGLGVSCTPKIYAYNGIYSISGQTHWNIENGTVLNQEIKRWIEANKFDIKIVDEYFY